LASATSDVTRNYSIQGDECPILSATIVLVKGASNGARANQSFEVNHPLPQVSPARLGSKYAGTVDEIATCFVWMSPEKSLFQVLGC
jgi:hypothetical protein